MLHRRSLIEKYALKKEEDRLARILSTVRVKLNEHAPISMLPFQILADIFAICALSFFTKGEPKHRLAWTQVCQTWRDTALNSPRLWTRINIYNSFYAHEFLKRSRTAPIHLVYDLSLHTHPVNIDLDGLQLPESRVNGITADLDLASFTTLPELLGPYFSRLEFLDLTVKGPEIPTPLLDLTPSLHLKRLRLRGVSVPWSKYLGLNQLTQLSLFCGDAIQPLTELLSILEGSPRLEYIELTYLWVDTRPRPRAITLPNLRELSIIESYSDAIEAVLEHVVLPPTTRLHIDASLILEPENEDMEELKPLFRSIMAHKTDRLKTIRHVSRSPDVADIEFLESATIPWADTPAVFLSRAPVEVFEMFALLDFTQITALEFGFKEGPQPRNWTRYPNILLYMPQLTTLRVGSSYGIVNLLVELTNAKISVTFDRDDHEPMLCPRLRHLSFGQPNADFPLEEKDCTALIRIVEARHNAAIPLETLEFTEAGRMSSEFRDQMDRLVTRKLVPAVIWRVSCCKVYDAGLY